MSDKRRRSRLNLTLAPDVLAALRARAEELDEPLGRVLDAAVREWLALPDPLKARPTA